jgi:hypothetical protein
MSFAVEPEALVKFAALVERNGINLSLSNVHLSSETTLGNTDGLWLQHLVDAHVPTVERMSSSLFRAFHVMGNSADELSHTAKHYRDADQAAEANLDTTYPASPRPPIEAPRTVPTTKEGQQGPFEAHAGDDYKAPLAYLTTPGTPADFSDPLALFNALGDYLSPTWWINQVLNDTIGVNPMEYVNQHLVGDWRGFARCAMVWEQLSKATGAIGDNVNNGLRWLAADWHGQAGDAAVYYFDYLGKSLLSHRDVFQVLHDKYREIARDVWLASKTLADIIKMIMDLVMVAGLAVLAGWALSWTGVGAGISWGVAAWECTQIVKLWGEASSLISTTQTAITGFVAFLTSPDAVTLREITPLPVPAIDYDHPGVVPEQARPRQKGE